MAAIPEAGRRPPRLVLRPLAPADAGALQRIHRTPEVMRWWGAPAAEFPFDDPDCTRFTIEIDGQIAGLIQYWEEREPRYRHAAVDLFLDPSAHGSGLGSTALGLLVRHLVRERGHHRVTVDPAVENAAAVRCYEKVGFQRVGVMRRYERDADGEAWHDGLLMEFVA